MAGAGGLVALEAAVRQAGALPARMGYFRCGVRAAAHFRRACSRGGADRSPWRRLLAGVRGLAQAPSWCRPPARQLVEGRHHTDCSSLWRRGGVSVRPAMASLSAVGHGSGRPASLRRWGCSFTRSTACGTAIAARSCSGRRRWRSWGFRPQRTRPGSAVGATIHACDTCVDKPCLSACPVNAFGPNGFDVASCRAYLNTEPGRKGCMTSGCMARDACPVGRAHRYGRCADPVPHDGLFINLCHTTQGLPDRVTSKLQ